MDKPLQDSLPYDPFASPRLPGVQPLDPGAWLLTDSAFAGQMALRDRLLATRREAVLALDNAARPAAEELLEAVLAFSYPGAQREVSRPDGARVKLNRADPLATVGRLVQEDFCLLEKRGEAHVLVGAVLCFPASWSLAEKFLRPLGRIHAPVSAYDEDIEARVQRLFDGVRPGRPLWRFNALWYEAPDLFQPRSETAPRRAEAPGKAPFLRSERQTLLRLPRTGAVVFSIHTYVLPRAVVRPREGAAPPPDGGGAAASNPGGG